MLQIQLKLEGKKLVGKIPSTIGKGEVEVVVDIIDGAPEGYSNDSLMEAIQQFIPSISGFRGDGVTTPGYFQITAIIG